MGCKFICDGCGREEVVQRSAGGWFQGRSAGINAATRMALRNENRPGVGASHRQAVDLRHSGSTTLALPVLPAIVSMHFLEQAIPLNDTEAARSARSIGELAHQRLELELRLASVKEEIKGQLAPINEGIERLAREVYEGRSEETRVQEFLDHAHGLVHVVRIDTGEAVGDPRPMTEEERHQPPLGL